MGKKSKPAKPKAPDYTALANQQSQLSQQLALQQTRANRPTQITPWGTVSWTEDPSGDWTQRIELSPQQQAALNAQMATQEGLSNLAQSLIGRVGETFGTPMDYSQLPAAGVVPTAGELPQADAAERQRIENALFERMRPEHARSQAALEGQLQNMGLTRGSEAWNREMERIGRQQAGERFNAMAMGGEEMQRLFNMGLARQGQQWTQGLQGAELANALRSQGLQEMLMRRSQPLNELSALMSGQQIAAPVAPGFTGATTGQSPNLLNAAAQRYQAGLDAYNAAAAQRSAFGGGIGSLIGGIGGAVFGGPSGAMIGSNIGGGLGRGLF
jgi:hypothetical protein